MSEVAALPEPAPHSIEAEALAKRFGGVVAVNEVSFHIERGELIGLIGPNGSGQTTLINLVTGALQPDDGRIRIDGRDMKGRRPQHFARAGVGRTFQVPRLFQRWRSREVGRLHRRRNQTHAKSHCQVRATVRSAHRACVLTPNHLDDEP